MRITVEIPDQFVERLVPAGRDAARSLLEDSVASAYRDRRLTMDQVRQLLGLGTRIQVDAFLEQHGIYDYTVDDLDKDMATLDRILASKPAQSHA
jgi:ribosomal protein L20